MPATNANHVWAYDFVFDACANGQQLKCLTVMDEYPRECLAIDVAGSIRSNRVLVSIHGAPRYLRSDNGPEFVSRAILQWLSAANIDTAHIDPGKPWQIPAGGPAAHWIKPLRYGMRERNLLHMSLNGFDDSRSQR